MIVITPRTWKPFSEWGSSRIDVSKRYRFLEHYLSSSKYHPEMESDMRKDMEDMVTHLKTYGPSISLDLNKQWTDVNSERWENLKKTFEADRNKVYQSIIDHYDEKELVGFMISTVNDLEKRAINLENAHKTHRNALFAFIIEWNHVLDMNQMNQDAKDIRNDLIKSHMVLETNYNGFMEDLNKLLNLGSPLQSSSTIVKDGGDSIFEQLVDSNFQPILSSVQGLLDRLESKTSKATYEQQHNKLLDQLQTIKNDWSIQSQTPEEKVFEQDRISLRRRAKEWLNSYRAFQETLEKELTRQSDPAPLQMTTEYKIDSSSSKTDSSSSLLVPSRSSISKPMVPQIQQVLIPSSKTTLKRRRKEEEEEEEEDDDEEEEESDEEESDEEESDEEESEEEEEEEEKEEEEEENVDDDDDDDVEDVDVDDFEETGDVVDVSDWSKTIQKRLDQSAKSSMTASAARYVKNPPKPALSVSKTPAVKTVSKPIITYAKGQILPTGWYLQNPVLMLGRKSETNHSETLHSIRGNFVTAMTAWSTDYKDESNPFTSKGFLKQFLTKLMNLYNERIFDKQLTSQTKWFGYNLIVEPSTKIPTVYDIRRNPLNSVDLVVRVNMHVLYYAYTHREKLAKMEWNGVACSNMFRFYCLLMETILVHAICYVQNVDQMEVILKRQFHHRHNRGWTTSNQEPKTIVDLLRPSIKQHARVWIPIESKQGVKFEEGRIWNKVTPNLKSVKAVRESDLKALRSFQSKEDVKAHYQAKRKDLDKKFKLKHITIAQRLAQNAELEKQESSILQAFEKIKTNKKALVSIPIEKVLLIGDFRD